VVLAFTAGCAPLDVADRGEGETAPDAVAASIAPLSSIECSERSDRGYRRGTPFDIRVVTVDGRPVEIDTANAYYVMASAAARDGVEIRVVSGFRTMSQQEYLYDCYTSCSCNGCALAARPGVGSGNSAVFVPETLRSPGSS
jgi:D-alanyl-D-alanine carboxypeptidase